MTSSDSQEDIICSPRFQLSVSNLIYFGLVVAVFVLTYFRSSPMTPYQSGYFFGTAFSHLVLPTLCGWIAFRVFGRSSRAGSITFNVAMTLIIFGEAGQHLRSVSRQKILAEMSTRQETIKAQLVEGGDPKLAPNEIVTSMQKDLNRLADSSTGIEKDFYRLMNEFIEEGRRTQMEWVNAINALGSAGILNYAQLNSDAAFDKRRAVVDAYLAAVDKQVRYFDSANIRLKEKLRVLGLDQPIVKGAIEGYEKKQVVLAPVRSAMFAAQQEHGKTIHDILDLLDENRKKWRLENGTLTIYDNAVLESFNQEFEKLKDQESALQKLSADLLKNG